MKTYKYFVSYSYSTKTMSGFGNAIFDLNEKISANIIRYIEKEILKKRFNDPSTIIALLNIQLI